jgi:hypothetical protein
VFLNYLALGMIIVVLIIAFYTFIYIHELPYEAAKHRNHPQQDAIYVACWLSLFTLHAIWPLVFLWALSYRDPSQGTSASPQLAGSTDDRLLELERRLKKIEELQVLPAQKTGAT